MSFGIDARLTPDEIASLREVSKGSVQRTIPLGNRERLLVLGFIQEMAEGLMLTEMGRARIATGR